MGNPMSELNGWYSSDEEYDPRRRRNSHENRRRGRRGGRSSRRRNLFDEKWDDPLDLFNDMTNFGFGLAHEPLGFGFDEDMKQMIRQAGASSSKNGTYSSTQMFSSVTTIGKDGVPVSESRGLATNSNGKYKMAHQRRIGDRSQTLTRERKNEHDDFQESQRLYQLSHGDLPKFKSEFTDRTSQWRSQRAIKERKKPRRVFDDRRQPRLALEDGRHSRPALQDRRKPRMLEDGGRSRAAHPSSISRPVSSHNYRRRSENYKNRPRAREY